MIQTQLLCSYFGVSRTGKLTHRKTISFWVFNFRETGLCWKWKSPGWSHHVWTPENMAAARDVVTQSLRCSVREQASALRKSQCSLRKILHKDLQFHPHKTKLVQEMKECDWAKVGNEKSAVKFCLKMLCPMMLFCWVTKLNSIFSDSFISKISATGLIAIHAKSFA